MANFSTKSYFLIGGCFSLWHWTQTKSMFKSHNVNENENFHFHECVGKFLHSSLIFSLFLLRMNTDEHYGKCSLYRAWRRVHKTQRKKVILKKVSCLDTEWRNCGSIPWFLICTNTWSMKISQRNFNYVRATHCIRKSAHQSILWIQRFKFCSLFHF